ncbi:class I SAM-dependent methyltransferase [Pontivivens nitratireducens]|uniref:class I SAM-dependent methyltransferase n=1 Tax=Pontivivens nitratireducens TaxID=2758038 RepID=UPI00163B2064|nr:class I SAM-dependent methyltransferase [Pontibrevibacter nitratireducens]
MSDPVRLELSGLDLSDMKVGCLGADPDPGWHDFADTITFEQRNKVDHDRMTDMRLNVVEVLDGAQDAMIVCLGRSRVENFGLLARACQMVPPQALIIVTGQKNAGVDSFLRQVRKILPVGEVLSKAHGKLFTIDTPAEAAEVTRDWFDAAQPSPIEGGWITAPGMFSADAPDAGSIRLAEHFSDRIGGAVADLGAGWGWLSAQLLATAPEVTSLSLYEADGNALDAARRNVVDERAGFHWADVTALNGSASFDWVISNPPFHHGRAAEPALGQAFIQAAARLLKPGGKALFVANRQLPYEAQLTESFKKWQEIPGPGAFKVFEAERPIKR